MAIQHIGARRSLEITPAGYAAMSPEKRTVWCLFGEAWGEYIFDCAISADDMAKRYRRETGDGSRLLQMSPDSMKGMTDHRHGRDGCVALRIGYKSTKSRMAKDAIDRALVAGYNVVIL